MRSRRDTLEQFKIEAKAHAKYSASGSKTWLYCPGSIRLSEKAIKELGPPKESPWAREGTQGHTVLEYLMRNRAKKLSAIAFLRTQNPIQMVAHADATLTYVEDRMSRLPDSELEIEVRCDLPVDMPGQFGTTDIAILQHFGRLVVIDYKYGAGIPVDVEENTQLIYYALGTAHKYDYNFRDVELVIDQPRRAIGFDAEGKPKTRRHWVTTIDKLFEYREIFNKGIKAAEKPNAPLRARDDICRFCAAKPICPEAKNAKFRQAQDVFQDEEFFG